MFEAVEILQLGDDILGDVDAEEGVDALPEVVVVLDLLRHDQAVVLCLKEVVIFVVYLVTHCTGTSSCVHLDVASCVEDACGQGEEALVGDLDVVDQVTDFPLQLVLGHPLVRSGANRITR